MHKNRHRLFLVLLVLLGILPLIFGILALLVGASAGPGGIGPVMMAGMLIPQGLLCTGIFGAAWMLYFIVNRAVLKAGSLEQPASSTQNVVASQVVVSGVVRTDAPKQMPVQHDPLSPYRRIGRLLPILAMASIIAAYLFLKILIDKSLLTDHDVDVGIRLLLEASLFFVFGFLGTVFLGSLFWQARLLRQPGYCAIAPKKFVKLLPLLTLVCSILLFIALWTWLGPKSHSQAEIWLNKFGSPILLPSESSDWKLEEHPGPVGLCADEKNVPAQSKGVILLCQEDYGKAYSASVTIPIELLGFDVSSRLYEAKFNGNAMYQAGRTQVCTPLIVVGSSEPAQPCTKILTQGGVDVYAHTDTISGLARYFFTKDGTYVMLEVYSKDYPRDKQLFLPQESALNNLVDTLVPVKTEDILAQYTIK